MAGNLKVDESIGEYKDCLRNMVENLSTNFTEMEQLKTEVAQMKWQGEARHHFVALLDIIVQYHSQLITLNQELVEGFDTLDQDIEAYKTYSTVVELEGIE